MSLVHRSVVVVSLAALTLTGLGTAAEAARPTSKPAKVVVKAKPVPKPVRFASTGTVSAVDATARTITITVSGGKLKVQSVSATVAASAKVVRNDAPATLGALRVGDKANVVGVSVGSVLTADGVRASGVADVVVAPTP